MAKVDFVPDREYLGEVTLASGDKVKVYMPTIGDVFDLDMSTSEGMYHMTAIACGMTFEEFKKLSIQDGTAICDKLGNALNVLGGLARGHKRG
jgi:hypothetical protein